MINNVMTAAAIAGLAASTASADVTISLTADRTDVNLGESVTWTVTMSLNNTTLPSQAFGAYLRWAFLDIVNVGTMNGVVSAFDFTYDTTDLNGVGTPRALIARSDPTGDDLLDVRWQINNLNGDGVGDYILGDTFESPFTLGTFTFVATGGGSLLTFDVQPAQDYIDSQSSVDAGVSWGAGTLGFSDQTEEFSDWTVLSDTISIPAPGAGVTLLAGIALLNGRRRRG